MQCSYSENGRIIDKCENGCDNCKSKNNGVPIVFQSECNSLISVVRCIISKKKKISIIQLVDYLQGKNIKKIQSIEGLDIEKYYGILSNLTTSQVRLIAIKLLLANVLREDLYKTKQGIASYLDIGQNEKAFSSGNVIIKLMKENSEQISPSKKKSQDNPPRLYIPARGKQAESAFSGSNILGDNDIQMKPLVSKRSLSKENIEDIYDRLVSAQFSCFEC